ncbi:MAG: hypothetical protein Kow0099_14240 [Candidatus Abyssubacteria bacterium]
MAGGRLRVPSFVWLLVGACVLASMMCCSRTPVNAPAEEVSVWEPVEENAVLVEPETPPVQESRKRPIEDMEWEIEELRWKNRLLKEENDWLRAEVIRLNQALSDANQNIYSLNRKLDAIFKPENSTK